MAVPLVVNLSSWPSRFWLRILAHPAYHASMSPGLKKPVIACHLLMSRLCRVMPCRYLSRFPCLLSLVAVMYVWLNGRSRHYAKTISFLLYHCLWPRLQRHWWLAVLGHFFVEYKRPTFIFLCKVSASQNIARARHKALARKKSKNFRSSFSKLFHGHGDFSSAIACLNLSFTLFFARKININF